MQDQLSYEDFKAHIDIQDVLNDAGYQFYRRDGLRYPSYVRLGSDGRRIHGDKFIVTANGKCCFHPPQQKVYNVISFITEHPDFFQEYYAGINPHHLVNLVCNRLLNHPIAYNMHNNIIKPQREVKPFDIKNYSTLTFQKHNMDNIKKFYPFFKSRMIDISTQKAFAGSFMLANKKTSDQRQHYYCNLSFPLHIPGRQDIVGFEERGKVRLDGTSGYKGKAAGSNSSEGLWIASPNGTELKNATDVLWFESAYDAMAYYQLHAAKVKDLGNAVFLSTGGNPTVMQFQGIIREAREACHHLCFDNDMAGKQFVMNFETELQHVKESLPKYSEDMKDYIESLHNKNDIFSGEGDFLEGEVGKAYGKFQTAEEELYCMHHGHYIKEDIEVQRLKTLELQKEYVRQMKETFCIGSEYGRLKPLGTYDIPDWALNAIENGDYDGLSDEEEKLINDFITEHFPDGYVSNINWDNYNELNAHPAFGTRNENALVSHGESPFEATKTYSVQFLHPTERECYALPNLTVVREVPTDGSKDWNEQLIREETERAKDKAQEKDDQQTMSAGLDFDNDGEVEISESEERKSHHTLGR